MTIAICDDVLFHAQYLEELITTYYIKRVNIRMFNNGNKLVDEFEKGLFLYDIIFLDILMPGFNGIDIAKTIRMSDQNIPIVFITASHDYAIEGYDVDAVSYVLKPLNFNKVKKILDNFEKKRLNASSPMLTVKTNGAFNRIKLNSITNIEKLGRKTILHRLNDQSIEINEPIKNLESILQKQPNFIKSYQNNYVNLSYAVSINQSERIIEMSDRKRVIVSRDQMKNVLDLFLKILGE